MTFSMNVEEYAIKQGFLHLLRPLPDPIKPSDLKSLETCTKTEHIVNNPTLGETLPERLGMRTISSDFDAATIPKRNWIIERYVLGNYIAIIGAGGATGKSMITLCLAVSVALGKDLLNLGDTVQGNALVINNEDDDDELDRRLAGIFKLYRIKNHEVTDKLYIKSGYGERVTISTNSTITGSTSMMSPNVEKIIKEIKRCDIKLLIVDPFVSTHQESENDNSAIDNVMSYYRHIASETGVAIFLVHHTRKDGDEADSRAGDVDVMRGASSLKDAARLCFTLAKMGKKTAKDHGIDDKAKNQLSRLDDAKNNFTLSDGKAKWFKMESVQIANGEWLGVPRSYDLPDAINGKEASSESKEHTTFSYIVRGVLSLKGPEGGAVKRPELMDQLSKESGHKNTKLGDDLQALPTGSSNARRVNVYGRFYRIHQVEGNHSKAAKTIHVILDE
ncbi:AAA family ATPase [Colwellia sp. BRX10-6]|uniref:AAA family ATPase n=1 Tax=unclassified Colwellia TaxID=196834 RepID=UPI0015F764D5|nr:MULTISPECIES: AAA family ATPase [unclassified Colwellia]MBA6385101.1 AAA family ATPase [Colwellia sp. BRX10-9]MBA6395932.1 AAA family ATPase [Colwellia sp. BRX10-6]